MRYPVPALWRVKVLDVHDGDTIKVTMDRGMDDATTISVRLKDAFAPELSQAGGRESRDYVLGWLRDNTDGTDWPFLLETFRTPRSDVEVVTLSRYVGVLRSATGRSLNADVQAFVTASGYGGGIGA